MTPPADTVRMQALANAVTALLARSGCTDQDCTAVLLGLAIDRGARLSIADQVALLAAVTGALAFVADAHGTRH